MTSRDAKDADGATRAEHEDARDGAVRAATASELRVDPLNGCPTAVAPGRRGTGPKGRDLGAGLPLLVGACPFCPGNEAHTGPTVHAWPPEGEWRVRVVPNRYPICSPISGSYAPEGAPFARYLAANGVHDVLVETREHDGDFAEYTSSHAVDVLRVYRDRLREIEATPGIAAVSVFRNRGRRSGSSQPHPHGQLLGLSYLGPEMRVRAQRAVEHHAAFGRTLLESVLEHELAAGARIVDVDDDFVVMCPFAPKVSHEVWIVPRTPAPSFSAVPDASLPRLVANLQRAIDRMLRVTDGADYNVVFRMLPLDVDARARFHYLELLPRRAPGAGFEWTTGMPVVAVSPEAAANELRKASRRLDHRVAHATLADGTQLVLRPITPDDRAGIARGIARMSKESLYRRFLRPIDALSGAALDYLTHVDGYRHIAWAAHVRDPVTGREDGVGVARCIREVEDPTIAEFAIALVDEYQRRGVGVRLSREVLARAYELGVRRVRALMLLENEAAFRLMARFSDVESRRMEAPGTAEVLFRLRPAACA